MNKPYIPNGHDIEVLDFLLDRRTPSSIDDISGGAPLTPEQARRSVNNLRDSGLVEIIALRPGASGEVGLSEAVINITDSGRRTFAAYEAGVFSGRL